MKKYIIKKHCEATELCTISTSRVQDYFYGKGCSYLSRDFLPSEAVLVARGLDTEEEALLEYEKRVAMADLEMSGGMWDITPTIMRCTIGEEQHTVETE